MPEGPEIHRAVSRIAKVLESQPLERVEFGQTHLRRFEETLAGTRVLSVRARGKAVVTHCSNGMYLYSHNQLYGRWYVVRREQWPSTNRVLRVALHTPKHSALLYSASDIEVLDEAGISLHPYLSKLGPDALDPDIAVDHVIAQLTDKRFMGRTLAALLLDQAFVAGIGNYLRSEILFATGLHPKLKPKQLSEVQLQLLALTTLDMTRLAYATAGITNDPERVAQLRAQGLKRRDYRFAVFDREGLPCYQCGAEIERVTLTARRLYLCRRCQLLS